MKIGLLFEFDIELMSKPVDWNTELKFYQFWKKVETRVNFIPVKR